MEKSIMKVNKIEPGTYEGYIWMSDRKIPDTYLGTDVPADLLEPGRNPFVIEAELFDKEKQISYQIKFVDGEYLVHKWEGVSADMNGTGYTLLTYYANRVGEDKGIKDLKLNFLQHWEEEADPECAGMAVLQPKELIFVGFNTL